jgi:CBS domain-containing protein
MKAKDIMTRNPEFVTPNDSISRAAEIMRDIEVGIVPVVDDSSSLRLRGVITDRDIAIRHVAEGHDRDCRVADHMTDRITSVSPDDNVQDVMHAMQRDQIRRVPVVENDRLVGIIAQADIALEAGKDHGREVQETLEKISEPGRGN